MLATDAVLVGDGGGVARSIPRPMRGAEAVGRALVAFYGQGEAWCAKLVPARVNGQPGFRVLDPNVGSSVVALDIAGGAVQAIRSMLNPEKLGHLGPLSDLGLRPQVR